MVVKRKGIVEDISNVIVEEVDSVKIFKKCERISYTLCSSYKKQLAQSWTIALEGILYEDG